MGRVYVRLTSEDPPHEGLGGRGNHHQEHRVSSEQIDSVLKHFVSNCHSITMASTERYSYSPNSPDLAVSTFDGRLIVYDTSLSAVKTEFVPSSHLSSAACTCVAWRPPKETRDTTATGAVDGTPGKR